MYDANETEAAAAARQERRRDRLQAAEAAGDLLTANKILRQVSREAKARRGLMG